jgi:hypothetical protein
MTYTTEVGSIMDVSDVLGYVRMSEEATGELEGLAGEEPV